jgi:hypothetical protein
MGKWGGYHTEFAHLARGFAGNDRALAQKVGEALLEAGLLAEKPSVGQRHVYLNRCRAGDLGRLCDSGAVLGGLRFPLMLSLRPRGDASGSSARRPVLRHRV